MDKLQISNYQRELMVHTIGDGFSRNFFGTGLGSKESKEFEKLVNAGYAKKRLAPDWMVDDVIYQITSAGRDALGECNT